jgi:hypothetical protein
MKNILLQPHVRQKIDKRVDRLLRDLENPEPPLRLEDVRELLKLDLAYYKGDDEGFLKETIHRLTVAGKQVLARPTLVLDAFRKFSLKAFYAPDRKRILIDEKVPKAKHRWLQGHEIIHDVLDWHNAVNYGDNELTIKQSCRVKIEAEANYGAGQLLFLRRKFNLQAMGSQPSIKLIRELAKAFNNTHASTMWRLVETEHGERPIVGVMHYHPHPRFKPEKFDPANPCRHFIQSDAFARQFSNVSEIAIYNLLALYCGPQKGGPLGEAVAVLQDDNGEEHEFAFETFSFIHECLTLGIHRRKRALVVSVPSYSAA